MKWILRVHLPGNRWTKHCRQMGKKRISTFMTTRQVRMFHPRIITGTLRTSMMRRILCVSRAYNQAFLVAKKLDLEWMLFADQDTVFPEGIYESYQQGISAFTNCDVFAPQLIDSKGIISPFRKGLTSGKRLNHAITGKRSLLQYQAINSGLLVSMKIFNTAGGYDERLKLDFSDFDFFKRLRQHTQSIVFLGSECKHEHSSTQPKNLDNAITRFKAYLDAITVMKTGSLGFMFPIRAFLRALKLSLRYRSFQFIGTYLMR